MIFIHSLTNYLLKHLLYAGTVLGFKDSAMHQDRQD